MSDDKAAETREVLGSAEYAEAFRKVMTGKDPGLLSDSERDVLRRAVELTGTDAPGYPMPLELDPTRHIHDDDGGDAA